MKSFIKALLVILLTIPLTLFAQLNAPEVEEVYGGRISWIYVIPISATQSRIFISTESANSMFYADVDHSSWPPVFNAFRTIPDLDADNGYGNQIREFYIDERSGYIFASVQGKIISANVSASSINILPVNGVMSLTVYDGYLFYVTPHMSLGLDLHFGEIDSASGTFSEAADSPVTITSSWDMSIQQTCLQVHPVNHRLYYFLEGEAPRFYKSSDSYDSLSASTTFSMIADSGVTGTMLTVYGIGPDGRLFAGGTQGVEPNHSKVVAFSDDDGQNWTVVDTEVGGVVGSHFAFAANDSGYYVYLGAAFSTNKGEEGTWANLGMMGYETHPNDGSVFIDPINPAVVYFTTDQGLGASIDSGKTLFEIDEGIEAVQVKDMEMNSAKTTAWAASKSGIRFVEHYGDSLETWHTFYPMDDGSPYYSVAMVNSHPDTAYAGNVRLYKTTDGGNSWTRVFTTEDSSYGFSFWSYVSAVEVHPLYDDLVVLGVNSPDMGVNGGIFISEDGGATWDRVDTDVYNTEVQDILIVPESPDSTTIYVACEYVNDGTHSSYGVKMLTNGPTYGPTFHNDMIGEGGGHITNFGAWALDVDSAGNVYACGANSTNEPRVYVKYADSSYWTGIPTSGLPLNGIAAAMTIGYDLSGRQTPYIAINSDLYYFDLDKNAWTLVFRYPIGTEINMLFWDDLLVGTSTGLYGQTLKTATNVEKSQQAIPEQFALMQNYPNPFNPTTIIEYRIGTKIKSAVHVNLSIFNVRGQLVRQLVNQVQQPGVYRVTFDASNLASGIYFYKLSTGTGFVQSKKMMLIR